jgi:hypothetical protein
MNIETIVVINIVKIKQMNLTAIILRREIALDIIINSEPSSRLSLKIITAIIEQAIDKIKIEKLCRSKTVLFHKAVGDNFTINGTKIKIKDKYNQYKPTETQTDLRLIMCCCM